MSKVRITGPDEAAWLANTTYNIVNLPESLSTFNGWIVTPNDCTLVSPPNSTTLIIYHGSVNNSITQKRGEAGMVRLFFVPSGGAIEKKMYICTMACGYATVSLNNDRPALLFRKQKLIRKNLNKLKLN